MNHTVLGLDLREATMPEAIAAMVEAWLRAQQGEDITEVCKAERMVNIYDWRKRNRVMPQTANALINISGFKPISIKRHNPEGHINFGDYFTDEQINTLDILLMRLRSGESMAKLRREWKRITPL